MKTINNYKLFEFLKQDPGLQEKYTKILMLSPAKETASELWELEFVTVFDFVENGLKDIDFIVELVSKLQGVDKSEVFGMRIVDFFPLVKHIKANGKKRSRL